MDWIPSEATLAARISVPGYQKQYKLLCSCCSQNSRVQKNPRSSIPHFHLRRGKPKAPPSQDHKARRLPIRPPAEGCLGPGTCVPPGKCLCRSPVNIFTKSALDMLITTSAVTGGFPKPALPPLVFRSMYQVPPSSPEQTAGRGDKAAQSAVPSLLLPARRTPPCPFGAVTPSYVRWRGSARRYHLPHVLRAGKASLWQTPRSTTDRGHGQKRPTAALCWQSWWQPALLT